MFRTRRREVLTPTKEYKKESELTKSDYDMINADRAATGIENYSDEYYYNHILNYNFK